MTVFSLLLRSWAAEPTPRPAQPPPPKGDIAEIIDLLLSTDAADQDEGARLARGPNSSVALWCAQIISPRLPAPEDDRLLQTAMLLAGEVGTFDLSQRSLVEALVGRMEFTMSGPAKAAGGAADEFARMPQIGAMIQIGLPCLDPLVKKVGASDSRVVLERSAIVIDEILGTEMAILYVKDRCRREADPVRRQRLQRLEEQIDKLERNRKVKLYRSPLELPAAVDTGKRN
jgi:hypothetical protein